MIPAASGRRRECPPVEPLGRVEEAVGPPHGRIDRADGPAAGDPPQLALELLDPLDELGRPARRRDVGVGRSTGREADLRRRAAGAGTRTRAARGRGRASENASARRETAAELGETHPLELGLGAGRPPSRQGFRAARRVPRRPGGRGSAAPRDRPCPSAASPGRRPRSPRRGAASSGPGSRPRRPAARPPRAPQSSTTRVAADQLEQPVELGEPAAVAARHDDPIVSDRRRARERGSGSAGVGRSWGPRHRRRTCPQVPRVPRRSTPLARCATLGRWTPSATHAERRLVAAEILSIGTELTSGETRDTNAGELARSLDRRRGRGRPPDRAARPARGGRGGLPIGARPGRPRRHDRRARPDAGRPDP